MKLKSVGICLLACALLNAQEPSLTESTLQKILERLENLERENKALASEVRALRQELAGNQTTNQAVKPASEPSLEERLAVQERRIEEQAQTKVEASQKLPVSLTGMLLFNAFLNSRPGQEAGRSPDYTQLTGPSTAGATLRQTTIGLEFRGPELPGNGRVNGLLQMDFFGGSSQSQYDLFRIRRGILSFDWKNSSFTAGQDAPLISPRMPNSLAQVGYPPLAGAGNLWLWQPQARFEQRFNIGESDGVRAGVGIFQTDERYAAVPSSYDYRLAPSRPGLQSRVEYWHRFSNGGRLELASGIHASSTHVLGMSVPSRVYSFDWFANPFSKIEFSGTVYRGQNFANLGALGQGFTITGPTSVRPVRGSGGWAQVSIPATSRITLNLFAGEQDDRNADLAIGGIDRNFAYTGNIMYRLGSNVIVSLEGTQVRTRFLSSETRVRNHYDLAIAYLF